MTRDLAAGLLRSGYRAIPEACQRAGDVPVCPVKLLGKDALVVRGPASVRRFYDPDSIRRAGAVPAPLAALLFGRGAVHGLDGAEHAHRKAGFLDLLDDDASAALQDLVRRHLSAELRERRGETVRVFTLLAEVYGRAVLEWAGISVPHPDRVGRRLAAIVDGFGISGPSYATAWAARLWANRWARGLVREARSTSAPPATPLEIIAAWRDPQGDLLPVRVAAIELLNVLRPAVAVAFLGSYAVQAIDDQPQARRSLGDPERRHGFTQEVRRVFPFVPALAGIVREHGDWDGEPVEEGQRIVLDVRGTNLDPESWTEPQDFSAERFVDRDVDPFELVPQGGGDPAEGHRCPGEPATIAMISATVEVFAGAAWAVVESGSNYPRIPTRERLRVRIG